MSMDFAYSFNPSACEECGGKCCTGESGYIFASVSELEKMAEFLGMEFNQFTQTYVKKVGYKFSLIEKSYQNGFACVFFDEECKNCGIYPVRPRQCRDFPFWEIFKEEGQIEFLLKECKGVKLEKNQ